MSPNQQPSNSGNQPTKTLTLSFSHPIHPRQIPHWRGAFIEMAGWQDNLFHNHKGDDGYIHRYPLIHYRVRKGNAALFAINEGVEALQKVLATSDWQINWEGQKKNLQIEDLRMNEHYLRFLPEPKQYRVSKWLALNSENYQRWQQCKGMIERVQLLERLLRNHIMACLWGLGWEPAETVQVQIEEIERTQMLPLHDNYFLGFSLSFSANVLLPSDVAIGKGVSHGFGKLWGVRTGIREENTRRQHSTSAKKLPTLK